MASYKSIKEKDLVQMLGCCSSAGIGELARKKLLSFDTRYRYPSAEEYIQYIGEFFRFVLHRQKRALRENKEKWQKGWQENYEIIRRNGINENTCRPRYFRKSPFLRFKGGLIVTPNLMLEHDLFEVVRRYLFQRYLAAFDVVHEFGCGSGSNLLLLSRIFPDKEIIGYDWVIPSVKIANEIGRQTGGKVKGYRFNMLKPDFSLRLQKKSAVITIHAMEQLGDKHGPMLNALLKMRPSLVMHYEPIAELYDEKNTFDAMAIWYTLERGYLNGYLNSLKEMEKKGKIKILCCRRPFIGGVYHESSLVIWRPA